MNDIKISGYLDSSGNFNLTIRSTNNISVSVHERSDYNGNLDEVSISWASGSEHVEELVSIIVFAMEIKAEILEMHKQNDKFNDKCVDKKKDSHVVFIGERVRCWDHMPMEGRPDRYVEGVVDSVEFGIVSVIVDKDTCFETKPRTAITTPAQIFFDYKCRITTIDNEGGLVNHEKVQRIFR